MRDRNRNAWIFAAATVGILFAARAVVRRAREYDLRGKTVLVTGGSRGLGLVLAREFVAEGAQVAICARDEAELQRAKADLESHGGRVLAVPCDVTDMERVGEMLARIRRQFGQIDVLVNNAGVIEVGPAEMMTLDDYEEAMKTNFWAPLYTMLAVLPEMRARREGRILNIASIGGKVSVPHLLPYSASKFALVGLSEGMRAELSKVGIVVTTVCPGLMRTGSPRNATFKGQHRAEYAWFSISDALPILSMNAGRAARKIISACKRGDAEVVLTMHAKMAVKLHDLFPGLMQDLLGLINRMLLPGPGGIGSHRVRGRDSSSNLSPSWLTTLNERAANDNNQFA